MTGILTAGERSWVCGRHSHSVREVLGEWEALTQREGGPGCVGGTLIV